MPNAKIRLEKGGRERFDAILTWKGPHGAIRYLVEEKRHLPTQDVRVIIEQLKHWRAQLPAHEREARLLLIAPHIRPQQAEVLQRAQIDYLDLAGNAHLQAPGVFVHIEGRKPDEELAGGPGRLNRAWIKAVMALLVRPDLEKAPYRVLADNADVALGTVAACMNDLAARGLVHKRQGGRYIVDRPQLVALWVRAYVDVLRPILAERHFQVRAETKIEIWDRLRRTLAEHDVTWALTGADAAELRTHFFQAERTEIYARAAALEDRELQKELIAQPAARVGNLVVIEPPGPLAIPAAARNTIPVAPELLAYAELTYLGTAQALEAAEMLLPAVLDHAALGPTRR
jgi:hypothetical protein